MATSFNAALAPDMNSDATFRTWATWISNVFTLSGGWVNTSDTGQVNLTTMNRQGANVSAGYKVYRMNDALQSTVPVFVKIEFGAGNSTANPSIWLTIGTGSDGAGNITGTLQARLQLSCTANSTTGTAAYGSVSTNRIGVGAFLGATTNATLAFFIERTKDAAGADTNTGILFGYVVGGVSKTQYLPFAGTIPTAETCFQALLSTNNPSAVDNNLGIGVVSYFYGTAQNPSVNNVVVNSNDFADYASFAVTIYSTSYTFQHLGSNLTTAANGRSGTRLCMLYQ